MIGSILIVLFHVIKKWQKENFRIATVSCNDVIWKQET